VHLGISTSPQELEAMLEDTPDSLNFTMFLAILSSRLQEYDAEVSSMSALHAFEHFDLKRTGKLAEADLYAILRASMSDKEIESVVKEAPRGEDGLIAYREFADILRSPF